jgi:hypothetical protein
MLKVRSGQVRTREGWRDRNSHCEHAGKRSGERGGLDGTTMRRVLISQNVLPLFVCIDSSRHANSEESQRLAFDLTSIGNVG